MCMYTVPKKKKLSVPTLCVFWLNILKMKQERYHLNIGAKLLEDSPK